MNPGLFSTLTLRKAASIALVSFLCKHYHRYRYRIAQFGFIVVKRQTSTVPGLAWVGLAWLGLALLEIKFRRSYGKKIGVCGDHY
jgi:hypothetical protein